MSSGAVTACAGHRRARAVAARRAPDRRNGGCQVVLARLRRSRRPHAYRTGGERRVGKFAVPRASLASQPDEPVGEASAASFLLPPLRRQGRVGEGCLRTSHRTVSNPSEPTPAFAGGGDKENARG